MFELQVEAEFCAAHTLTLAGTPEPVHGHNFRVTVALEGPTLDADGLLCDFHAVEAALAQVLAPLTNIPLNTHPAFARVNPSAENLAAHIARTLSERLSPSLPPGGRVAWVRVTEAPRCAAVYRMPR